MTTAEMTRMNRVARAAGETPLRSAALIAGIGLLIMAVAAPFAELFVYPKLLVVGNAAETYNNLLANQSLFVACILSYLVTFICDLLVAWALYILLKPVHANVSLLTALFRWVYTLIALIALLDLVKVLRMINSSAAAAFPAEQLQAQVLFYMTSFKSDWYFGLLFFAMHLVLLGYLVFRSTYIPKVLGILLVIAGLGYFVSSLRPFFPAMNVDLASYTFYGELIFMLWLLIRGPRIQEAVQ